MIKRTLCISSPAYLNLRDKQLVVNLPGAQGMDDLVGTNTVPIEDIGLVLLDNRQITISSCLIEALMENNAAVISCDARHMPSGLLQPLEGHTLHTERLRTQVAVSKPLSKQLWQQTIQQKIRNQAANLLYLGLPADNMLQWADQVQSGDAGGHEARAAAHYWSAVFPQVDHFRRDRDGLPPNNLLNYGYAIVRALVARAIASCGMHPALGLFHRNKYNPYCLADDLMEPYRPYIDRIVINLMHDNDDWEELTYATKLELLSVPTIDTVTAGQRSPLMTAVQASASSLWRCYSKESRTLDYPVLAS